MTEQKRHSSTLEEKRAKAEEKLAKYERQLQNREVKKVWQSDFRKMKSKLNHSKDLDAIEKIQKFVNWIYEVTEIIAEPNEETETEE